MSPDFFVSAEYFYAVTAGLPPEVGPEQRYRLVCNQDERQLAESFRKAGKSGVIDLVGAPQTPEQAARRLRALGTGRDTATAFQVAAGSPVYKLIEAWLTYKNPTPKADPELDIMPFWDNVPTNADQALGHLHLVLFAITQIADNTVREELLKQIQADFAPPPVVSVEQLRRKGGKDREEKDWRAFFAKHPVLLPPFTAPGSLEERTAAFIRHLRQFFNITQTFEDVGNIDSGTLPAFGLADDFIGAFVDEYRTRSGKDFVFGKPWDAASFAAAIQSVFPNDPHAQAWLAEAIRTIDALYTVAEVAPPELRFSVAEALYARGFTSVESIQEYTAAEFQEALVGTIAHEYAVSIYRRAGGSRPEAPPRGKFRPVNPDGRLLNCVPPPHLSPFGIVNYLRELLRLDLTSTCERPFPETGRQTVGDTLDLRRGPLGDLDVTPSNASVPLPLIDIAVESLEYIAADEPSPSHGVIYNTATDKLAGHALRPPSAEARQGETPFRHDPETLLAALPEHSSPATPVKKPKAYDKLQADFSRPLLPYSQPLDIGRTYLRALRTSRYAVMRRFRENITEWVLDPAKEPAEFQRNQWRYPVRIAIAREYLGLTPEEHEFLFTFDLIGAPPRRNLLEELYGFGPNIPPDWIDTVRKVPEFLKRTGLTYCEFLELWRSEFVRFRRRGESAEFELCEPCYLDQQEIQFEEPRDPREALKRLVVFIRLWRKLLQVDGAQYSFAQLRDICEVLQLFLSDGSLNPDFIRQLAALQMLRDHFALRLFEERLGDRGTGADRSHLLALWVGPGHLNWSWAVDHFLDQLRHYAQARFQADPRPAEFLKLLQENLNPLSRLAGFDPDRTEDRWYTRPTHTLRFAEVLAKLYASDFGIGEILFLFTVQPHLDGDDPFPLSSNNEALDSPLDLPDDDPAFSLWELRRKLLKLDVSEEQAATWTWSGIESSLRSDFGLVPAMGSPDPLLAFGEHFFPSFLEAAGSPVPVLSRQYRVSLSATSELMWNTPPEGPFRYDRAAKQLWAQLPLGDEAVFAKLSRVKPLSAAEQQAVQDVYYLPRLDLARLGFLFSNLAEADRRLVQEPDEKLRFSYFQRQFARFHARCRIIAEHLSAHVAAATGQPSEEGVGLARYLLRHLLADENLATAPWDAEPGGPRPPVTWGPAPVGGAYAALLGLVGTGLLGEFSPVCAAGATWRELRGPMDAFGVERNAWLAPVPGLIPAMDLKLTPEQERFIGVRNGFALANADGTRLGGAEGFSVTWRGMLLVETAGPHEFWAGAPTPDGEVPNFACMNDRRWRVTLQRGQKTWVVLSHRWPDEDAPAAHCAPLLLRRGAYELTVEFIQPQPVLDGPEDVHPQTTGFQIKYCGPDTGSRLIAPPFDRLFLGRKNGALDLGLAQSARGKPLEFLRQLFPSTLRDIRRTYQRAFKALLFAHRFGLSAKPLADSGQSEIGYLIEHGEDFAGRSYYRKGAAFEVHKAYFDFNLLPLADNYFEPSKSQDSRMDPSPQRQQALFDWWERVFDYTTLRREAQIAPERPAWLLFHEAAEMHTDDSAHLLRHIGVDLSHADIVLRYYRQQNQPLFAVRSAELRDERWTIRTWQAEKWLRSLGTHFLAKNIREAHPALWSADDPSRPVNSAPPSGNEDLSWFFRSGLLENGEPRRYAGLKQLNDELRERARQALLAYLCAMDRVALPWGGLARSPKDLSELLLIDVEAGLCQRACRIEAAISSVQNFIQRARLDLEATWRISPEFRRVFERRFATYRIWELCQRRETYRENWIDSTELEKARRTEGFRFMESELRRSTLTVAEPGGSVYWNGPQPRPRPGLTLLQGREPASLGRLVPTREGFGLLGTPERQARPSWLAVLPRASTNVGGNWDEVPRVAPGGGKLPFWIEAAIRLGTRFVRLAAAGIPAASAPFAPNQESQGGGCCVDCGRVHDPVMDEYYFWIIDSRRYDAVMQSADVKVASSREETAWHDPDALPKLLNWESKSMVHLMWCRVHNGEFQPPRRSHEGLRIGSGKPDLRFMGRTADSLRFEVDGGDKPPGYPGSPPPGFLYDLTTDTAEVLPLLAPSKPLDPAEVKQRGGLPVYPYFAFFAPGAPLVPTLFSPVMAIAASLRAHCRFEAALKWYEQAFHPLEEDARWCHREERPRNPSEPPPDPLPGGTVEEACCTAKVMSPEMVRNRALLLAYLETLLQWGDALMRRNTPEAFQQARLLFDTAARILGQRPQTILEQDKEQPPRKVSGMVPKPAPLNPRLLSLYDQVSDRLTIVHACLNARRLKNGRPSKDMPYFGDSSLRDGWQTTAQACLDDGDWCSPHSPYRFQFLVQKSQELAGEVRALGASLLAAFEKGDAEYLAALRASHERQLLSLALAIRQDQWREADWQVQALRKTKEIALTRRRYYQLLIDRGLNGGEVQYQALTNTAIGLQWATIPIEAIAQVFGLIPDLYVGFPVVMSRMPIGTKLAEVMMTVARILSTSASATNNTAGLRLTEAGWVRREEEWRHQVEVLSIEIEQIERQILAAERRRDISLRELNNHRRQMEHSAEVQDFLRDKFTNHQLYLWLQRETAALHYQMYELALHTARQAQRAFNYERGHTARTFVPADAWDNLREGLQAGERLHAALRHMEKAYLDENLREYELTKHLSLRLNFPLAFLQLKVTGSCEIELPEWMLDLEYPGHYMRRIKNVTLTIPCVVGPYVGVHCRLTLLSSTTRVDPRLGEPTTACCDAPMAAQAAGCVDDVPEREPRSPRRRIRNGYEPSADDPRIVKQYAATEAIATSSGQNDSGLFELNFRDERYLPFEFAGAVSRWRIELPKENNYFDLDTLSDVVMHLNYTAREGGEVLRRAAQETAQQNTPDNGWRLFDLRHEFPTAWQRLQAQSDGVVRHFPLRLTRNMFAFLPGRRELSIYRLHLLLEAPGSDPSAHRIVEFLPGVGHPAEAPDRCDIRSIYCVASAEWPGLFHGVLDIDLGSLAQDGPQDIGTLRLPPDMGHISRAFLLCRYDAR